MMTMIVRIVMITIMIMSEQIKASSFQFEVIFGGFLAFSQMAFKGKIQHLSLQRLSLPSVGKCIYIDWTLLKSQRGR